MEADSYRQCGMRKKHPMGVSEQTAWIPEKFAVMGKILRLKDDDGWEVISVGTTTSVWSEVNERSRDHLSQRGASDI